MAIEPDRSFIMASPYDVVCLLFRDCISFSEFRGIYQFVFDSPAPDSLRSTLDSLKFYQFSFFYHVESELFGTNNTLIYIELTKEEIFKRFFGSYDDRRAAFTSFSSFSRRASSRRSKR